jgi:hypothetical protein
MTLRQATTPQDGTPSCTVQRLLVPPRHADSAPLAPHRPEPLAAGVIGYRLSARGITPSSAGSADGNREGERPAAPQPEVSLTDDAAGANGSAAAPPCRYAPHHQCPGVDAGSGVVTSAPPDSHPSE